MDTSKKTREQRTAEERREMEAIMTTHESELLRYAGGIVHSPHAAQDVVQNVFIKLFRQWKPGMQPTPALRGWLYRVTHNEAVDHLRSESRRSLLHLRQAQEPETMAALAPSNPGPGADTERMERVLDSVRRLHPSEQQIVLLRLQQGLSYKDIGRITGRSEGNVGCLLHHAVRKLSRLVQGGRP